MKKERITASTSFRSRFITLWRGQSFRNRVDTKSNAKKSYRGKKTETGGSDPTFLRPSRPKVSWGRSRPPAQKPVPFLFSTVIRSSQTAMKGSTEHELRPFHRAQE